MSRLATVAALATLIALSAGASASADVWAPSQLLDTQGAQGFAPSIATGPEDRVGVAWPHATADLATVGGASAARPDAASPFAPGFATPPIASSETQRIAFEPGGELRSFWSSGASVLTATTNDPTQAALSGVPTPISFDAAIGPDGTAAVAATAGPNVEVAVRPKGATTWTSDAVAVSPDVQPVRPAVGIDAAGDVTVAWFQYTAGGVNAATIVTAFRPAGGQWTPTGHPLAVDSRVNGLRIAVQPDGRTLLVADGTDQPLAYDGDHGAFGPAQTLGSTGTRGGLAMAENARGDAVVSWFAAANDERPVAVTRRAGGAFSAPTTLGGCGGVESAAAIDADGRAVVAFVVRDAGQPNGTAVLAGRTGPDGGWYAAEPVSAPGEQAGAPAAVVDSGGRALLAYDVYRDPHVTTTTQPLSALPAGAPLAVPDDAPECRPPQPTPVVQPPPPAQPAPRLAMTASLDVAHRRVRVAARCPAPSAGCRGTLALSRAGRAHSVTAIALAAGAARRYRLRVPSTLALRGRSLSVVATTLADGRAATVARLTVRAHRARRAR